ncbi:Rv1733c family protein [Streptomyces sediminimaris]|uniref:Rv1733c family protein n=1 Tax=Streptomyces sediminimaris TaxID=3383721 RepID=UPI00399B9DA8
MRKARRTTVLGWRWRRNPLRRRSDVLEAWIVLAAWTLAAVASVAAGIVGARVAQHVVDAGRAGRSPVTAVLVRIVPGSGRDVVTGVRYDRVVATVRWSDVRDGRAVTRTGLMNVRPTARPGSTVRTWTDGHGHLVAPPVGATEATVRVLLAGTGAAPAAGATVLGTGYLARLRVQRRATEKWGAEWERAGRHRGHTTG